VLFKSITLQRKLQWGLCCIQTPFSLFQEFFQQHIIGESGLAVRVRDTHKHMAAFWKAADFMEWLCQLRDYESVSYFIHVNYVTCIPKV
jgi:hypothetical protein